MSEIKRYDAKHFGDFEMIESPQGEWVRWEDVENLLQKQEDNYAHETQLLTERINRLVSKND